MSTYFTSKRVQPKPGAYFVWKRVNVMWWSCTCWHSCCPVSSRSFQGRTGKKCCPGPVASWDSGRGPSWETWGGSEGWRHHRTHHLTADSYLTHTHTHTDVRRQTSVLQESNKWQNNYCTALYSHHIHSLALWQHSHLAPRN